MATSKKPTKKARRKKNIARPSLPLSNNFGNIIRRERKKKGYSQFDLGFAIDLSQSEISKIEWGQVEVKGSKLMEIAKTLEVSLDVFEEKEEPQQGAPAGNQNAGKSLVTQVSDLLKIIKQLWQTVNLMTAENNEG